MKHILYILLLLPFIGDAQIKLHGNANEVFTGSYQHNIVSSTNDTTHRVEAATGNLTTLGLTKSRRFLATDTIGSGSSEPAFNIERTLSGELTGQATGYNERTTITRAQSTTYAAYRLQTNIGASASGLYGLCMGFVGDPGVNVTDTMTQWRTVSSQGAINNSSGRVQNWYGFYYQEPSGSGQIYDKHAAIRIQNQTKGTNRWAIQSYSSAPSAFLGNVGLGLPTDSVPVSQIEVLGGGTSEVVEKIKAPTGQTTDISQIVLNNSRVSWFDSVGYFHTPYAYLVNVATTASQDSALRRNPITGRIEQFALPTSGGSGTVTSVGLTTPSWLTVSGSPVTTSGTLAVSAATGQTANQFLATPDGSTGAVGLRAIVAADIPTLNQNTTGSAATLTTTRTIWGQNFNGSANVTGDITLGTGNITMTGSIGATGARVIKGWFTDGEFTNAPTVGGVALPTATSTTTFTNKTLTSPIISSISNTGTLTLPTVTSTIVSYRESNDASTATPTPIGDARQNKYYLTALATAPTFAAPSGTPANGNELLIRIKDNGTARALSWNAIYRGGTSIALPTTTTISKTMYVQFVYNSADSKWDLVGLTDGL